MAAAGVTIVITSTDTGREPIAVDRALAPLDPEAHAAVNEGVERRS
jgi:hypothetical protein